MPADDPSAPAPRHGPGCLTWLLIATALSLLAVEVAWLWYCSDADLRAVEEEPGGLPAEVVADAGDPAAVTLQRLAERRAAGSAPDVAPPGFWDDLHAACVALERARAAGRVPGLEGVGPTLVGRLTERLGGPSHRKGAAWLEVPPCTEEQAAQTVADAAVLLADGEHVGAATGLTQAVAAWRAAVGPLPAARLDPLAQGLRTLRASLWRTRAREAARLYHLLRADLRRQFADVSPGLNLLVLRMERADLLRAQHAGWAAINGATTPADLWARWRAVPPPPSSWLGRTLGSPPWRPRVSSTWVLFELLALDVLLADLAADDPATVVPLTDPFDPPHPLHPILRAPGPGLPPVRIGWYSVGPDGVDDGGADGYDIGVATVGILGPQRFADPQ